MPRACGIIVAVFILLIGSHARAHHFVPDPALPPPTNVRDAPAWMDLTRTGGGPIHSVRVEERAVVWDRPATGAIQRYVVERRVPGREARFYAETADGLDTGVPYHDCVEQAFYQVWGVIEMTPDGHFRTTQPSAETEIRRVCAFLLQFELVDLQAHKVRDGCCSDRTAEAYGRMSIVLRQDVVHPTPEAIVHVRWNPHCDSGGSGACLSSTTSVPQGRTLPWQPMNLSIEGARDLDPSFRRNNNRFGFIQNLNTAEKSKINQLSLSVSFVFKDHDDWSGDDIWCATPGWGREVTVLQKTPEDWVRTAEELVTIAAGNCTVTLRVSGLRRLRT
jgi:hypothetical protein